METMKKKLRWEWTNVDGKKQHGYGNNHNGNENNLNGMVMLKMQMETKWECNQNKTD